MKAVIVAIGSELVTGQTIDTNSGFLARQLGRLGIETIEHVTVGDDRRAIADVLTEAAERADLVIVSGGLGPTPDDLTRHALADAMGVDLVSDPDQLERIERFFAKRGRKMIPANRVQATFPRGAEPLTNEVGTAPGIHARLGDAEVYVVPGVPSEMRWMYGNVIRPRLPAGQGAILHRVLHSYGQGESDIAARITDLMRRDDGPVRVGTTVAAGLVSMRVTARGADEAEADNCARRMLDEIRRRLGDLVVGEGEETMASAVGTLLRSAGQTVATAESCTGGLVGELITSVPGSSEYFLGGVVTYTNRMKRELLGVPAELLEAHGAVSKPVARAMADGARRVLAADWAIALTGIAGPTGGSDEKPVGLVWIALSGPDGTAVHRHVFPGTREIVRHRSALMALNHLRLALRR